MKLFFIFVFGLVTALSFPQKKQLNPLGYRSFSDSCFKSGDFIRVSFMKGISEHKVELIADSVKKLRDFFSVHKNLRAKLTLNKVLYYPQANEIENAFKDLGTNSQKSVEIIWEGYKAVIEKSGKVRKPYNRIFQGNIASTFTFLNPQTINYRQTPKNRNDLAFAPGDILGMPGIYFDLGKYALRPESKDSLKKWAAFIKEHPDLVFQIVNHSDSRGSDKYSADLTGRRAQCCRDYMIKECGVPAERLSSKGYGASQLLIPEAEILKKTSPAEKEELHQQNRRMELRILGYTGDCVLLFNP